MPEIKTAAQIRETFLGYFEEQGHQRIKSSSLIPQDDPTLLFTNAGMNQFKDVFLGLEKRDYNRATTSQKCMRVSGKHNDLETVGRTARHHTFFEMLGNFSFGDYFKKQAITFAWELCVQVYGLSPDQIPISVYEDDEDAYTLWRSHIGVPENRLFRFGEKDNFWAMGETGPCGPCSELYYDLGSSPWGHTDCRPDCECGRYIEIWNLVFMQLSRDDSGQVTPLPSPSIDTGMGLERISGVLQGVSSNYDTDLFRPLIQEAARLTQSTYGSESEQDVSLRILADHSRAAAFLITDGVVPSNEGRGYVLRKILRRAARHGQLLGQESAFLFTLAALAADLMKDAYPELENSREFVATLVKQEEHRFSATLSLGTRRLDEICAKATDQGQTVLAGEDLFRLYDTYGFPLDLAQEIAAEKGFQVDQDGFYSEMEKQKQRARASWTPADRRTHPIYHQLSEQLPQSEFTGYAEIKGVAAKVLEILKEEESVPSLAEGESGQVVLDRTPFYAEAGGQIADRGVLDGEDVYALVKDVHQPVTALWVHHVEIKRGELKKGDEVRSSVFEKERSGTTRNHTATHLLHAALREILGPHVKQAGSLVAPDRLRFDFNHYQPVSSQEIRELEELVNARIRDNIEVQSHTQKLEDAIEAGATALFGEKYLSRVRVVTIPGFSMELCGGTHVSRTGDIALFKILHEGSVSAGVRRIEALTGKGALKRFLDDENLLEQITEQFRMKREGLADNIRKLADSLKDAQVRIEQLQLQLAKRDSAEAVRDARKIKGVKVVSQKVQNLDRNGLRILAGQLADKLRSGVVVLGMPANGKVSLVAMVTSDLTDRIQANDLIRRLAPLVGGAGGGKPDMAEAGGKDPSQLDEALEQAFRLVADSLE